MLSLAISTGVSGGKRVSSMFSLQVWCGWLEPVCRVPAFLLCTLLRNAAKDIARTYKVLRRDDEEHNIWSPVRKIQKGFDYFCLSLTYSPTCAAYLGWAFSVMLKFM